jgi:hypothetical protein
VTDEGDAQTEIATIVGRGDRLWRLVTPAHPTAVGRPRYPRPRPARTIAERIAVLHLGLVIKHERATIVATDLRVSTT